MSGTDVCPTELPRDTFPGRVPVLKRRMTAWQTSAIFWVWFQATVMNGWFPRAHESSVHTVLHLLKCAKPRVPQTSVRTVIKKHVTVRHADRHLSLQQVLVSLLVEVSPVH